MDPVTVHLGDISQHMQQLSRGFLFTLVIGTTDTSLIPGITIAGGQTRANPLHAGGRCRIPIAW
ncbi:hypothetical protein [Vulcanisaeta distributa]|uniref:hypothetical protein n=1 Tax=Vulcanisaeta distributa TaxID=164451 RepID=UPI000A780F3F|nr:hypothetical protein [Vulcanisaeta distributa]